MRNIQKLLALLLTAALCCGVLLFPSAAAEETPVGRTAIIQAGAVNVRAAADENAERIGGLTLGKEVYVLNKTTANSKVWYKIYYQDTVGYILGSTALLIKDIGMVAVGALNVRTSADSSSYALGELTYGRRVYILETVENGSGETWYKISYGGLLDGYVMTKYIGIMALPTQAQSARYKKDVTLHATAYNVPIGYSLVLDEEEFHASTGEKEYTAAQWVGQLTENYTIPVRIVDEYGSLKAETKLVVEVKNGVFAKIGAFFLFVFGGFRWGSQTVELR